MKMRKHWIFATLLLTLAALVFMACDDESTAPADDQNSEEQQIQENAEAAYYTALYSETMAMPASALVAATSGAQMLAKSPTGIDTIFSGCPTATFDRIKNELLLDYGTGCSGAAGVEHSGSILLKGQLLSGQLVFQAYFNDYTANNYKITGEASIKLAIDSIYIGIDNAQITHGDTTVQIFGELRLVLDMNNTYQNPFDDTFTVYGGLYIGTMISGKQVMETYGYILDADPLVFQLLCEYPYRGIIAMTYQNKNLGKADFEPNYGGCDDVVAVYPAGSETGKLIYLNDLF